mmetsp:Transcript_15424/g.28053  ORF Transcript_15424/g.28053 Transcript_15424/m.28053 type:complete len:99 (-) Transcript_15424:75-371(-)
MIWSGIVTYPIFLCRIIGKSADIVDQLLCLELVVGDHQKKVPTKFSWSDLAYCWFQASCRLGWAGGAALMSLPCKGASWKSYGGLVVHDHSNVPRKFR